MLNSDLLGWELDDVLEGGEVLPVAPRDVLLDERVRARLDRADGAARLRGLVEVANAKRIARDFAVRDVRVYSGFGVAA